MRKRFWQVALTLGAATVILLGNHLCSRLLSQTPPPPPSDNNYAQPPQGGGPGPGRRTGRSRGSYPRADSRGVCRGRLLQSPARPDHRQTTSQANRGGASRGKTGGRLYLDPRLLGLGPRPRQLYLGHRRVADSAARARLGCPAIGTRPPTDINGSAAIGDRRHRGAARTRRHPTPSISPHRRKASRRAPARPPPRPTISGCPAIGIGLTDGTCGGQATGAAASRIGSGSPPGTSGPPAATSSSPGIGISPWPDAAWSSARSTYANPYYLGPSYYYTPSVCIQTPVSDGLLVLPAGLWPLLFRRLLRSDVRECGHLSLVHGPRTPLRLRAAVRLRSLVLRAERPGLGDRLAPRLRIPGGTRRRPAAPHLRCRLESERQGRRRELHARRADWAGRGRRRGECGSSTSAPSGESSSSGRQHEIRQAQADRRTTEFKAHAQARANGGQPVRHERPHQCSDHLAAGDQCRRPPGGHDCRPDRRFQRIRAAERHDRKITHDRQ